MLQLNKYIKTKITVNQNYFLCLTRSTYRENKWKNEIIDFQ